MDTKLSIAWRKFFQLFFTTFYTRGMSTDIFWSQVQSHLFFQSRVEFPKLFLLLNREEFEIFKVLYSARNRFKYFEIRTYPCFPHSKVLCKFRVFAISIDLEVVTD